MKPNLLNWTACHIVYSALIDHRVLFSLPGDPMQDKYNLNTNPNEGLYDQADLQDMAIDDPHGLQMGKKSRLLSCLA